MRMGSDTQTLCCGLFELADGTCNDMISSCLSASPGEFEGRINEVEDGQIKMAANNKSPTKFTNCEIVMKSIGLVQQKKVRPFVPETIKHMKRQYEVALTMHVAGVAPEAFMECAVCNHLEGGGLATPAHTRPH